MSSENTIINEINLLETTFREKSDFQLKEYASFLRNAYTNKKTESDEQALLITSFALVREASARVLGLRPYDTQLLGGVYLHQGKIAEMKTGEGKTLVASLPSFLNGLSRKGVHIVTVNNYLAKRDQKFIGRIFRFLDSSVGLIQENMSLIEKKANYNADITYVTNSEIAFDYLRDCTAPNISQVTQRPFNYCIIDEVDSILIDEARTPLILSNSLPAHRALKEKIFVADSVVRCLELDDYELDEKAKNIFLTPKGRLKIEDLLEINNLYDSTNPWINYINNALKAHFAYRCNTDYIVAQDKIFIVDEFTGRILADRRWSDGLHQAVEVKEKVSLSPDSETFASITYQNFFRLYPKLSGMTGTAKTEEVELQSIYNLSVIEVPTYKPMIRKDLSDLVYIDEYAKWKAVQNQCANLYKKGIPTLVGTSTLAKSELLSTLLKEQNVPHQLLNARPENVKNEAEIIAQAGKKYAVTIATNMAGRGTDIILGGNKDYLTEQALKLYFKNNFYSKQFLVLEFLLPQNSSISKSNYQKLIAKLAYYKFLKTKQQLVFHNKFLEALYICFWELKKGFYNQQKLQVIAEPNLFQKFLNEGTNSSFLNPNLAKIQFLNYIFYKTREIYSTKHVFEQATEISTAGGLHVLGTERQDSRRIDNQLRGRSGRQGDPGVSQFFLSLDDRLLKLFANDNLKNLISGLSIEPDEPIQAKLVTRALEKAQERVESFNFGIRKQLFEYDEVLEEQRAKLFLERKKLLETKKPREWILQCCELVADDLALNLKQSSNLARKTTLDKKRFLLEFLLQLPEINDSLIEKTSLEFLRRYLYQQIWLLYELREEEYIFLSDKLSFSEFERLILVTSIDQCWTNHLQKMALLRESVGWRVFAQKKPIREYKIGGYYLFKEMLVDISHQVFSNLFLTEYFLKNI